MSDDAKGGYIPRDSIPVWLPDNSYIINAAQSRRWLDLLKRINSREEEDVD